MPSIPRLAIFAPTANKLGGVQTWLDYVTDRLSESWNVTPLLASGKWHDLTGYLQEHPLANVIPLRTTTGTEAGRRREVLRLLRAVEPDVVLCVNLIDAAYAVADLKATGSSAPRLVLGVHGLHSCYLRDAMALRGNLDGVIATNKLAVRAMQSLAGIDPSRCHYAPCGVDIASSPSTGQYSGTTLLLSFVGRLDQAEKRIFDIDPILRSVHELGRDFRLAIAGTGPDELELRRRLAWAGERVVFHGVLDDEKLGRRVYVPGSILLMLSPHETGPLVIWEAMSRGVAVASSRYVGSGLEGALRDRENCVLFPVGDVNAAVHGLLSLCDYARYAFIVSNAFTLVRTRYSVARSVEAWSRALHSALEASVHREPVTRPPNLAGRLDRLLGVRMGDRLRTAVGRTASPHSAGAEWPHSYGSIENDQLQREIFELDGNDAGFP